MSDEKSVTEREAIERERKAFVRGVERMMLAQTNNRSSELSPYVRGIWSDEAKKEFPQAPKIVPRVVRNSQVANDFEFRIAAGRIQERYLRGESDWREASGWPINLITIRMFADLLANPTEEQPDE